MRTIATVEMNPAFVFNAYEQRPEPAAISYNGAKNLACHPGRARPTPEFRWFTAILHAAPSAARLQADYRMSMNER